jgi:hypothetical protein
MDSATKSVSAFFASLKDSVSNLTGQKKPATMEQLYAQPTGGGKKRKKRTKKRSKATKSKKQRKYKSRRDKK